MVSQDGRITAFFYLTVDQPFSMIPAWWVGLVIRRPSGGVSDGLGEPACADVGGRVSPPSAMTAGWYRTGACWVPPSGRDCGAAPAWGLPGPRGQSGVPRPPAEAADLDAIVTVDWSAFEVPWRNGPPDTHEFLMQMPHFSGAEDDAA